MIPVRLKLRNFMPYRGDQAPVSFCGIHTACISGDNGAGKSTLIDAITWALWGKARTNTDDDLISISAGEAEVEFDFNASGFLYRIIRKRTKSKRSSASGQSSLDLQMSTGAGFQSITGDTINQTQKNIIDLLHMDYDTFINSAYLRQGHADEFSRQTPAKRKDVLASILKLDVYDLLADSAKQKARTCQTEKELLEISIKEINRELENKHALIKNYENVQQEFKRIETKNKTCQHEYENLKKQKQILEGRQEHVKRLKIDIGDRQKQIDNWQRRISASREKIAYYENILAQSSQIENGYSNYTHLKQTFDEMGQNINRLNRLIESKNRLEREIEAERSKLSNQFTIINTNVKDLDGKVKAIEELQVKLNKARADLSDLEQADNKLRLKEAEIKKLEVKIKEFDLLNSQMKTQIKEIDHKMALISKEQEANCPVCAKPLSDNDRNTINDNFEKDKRHILETIEHNQQKKVEIKAVLEQEVNSYNNGKNRLRQQQQATETEISILQHQINECRQAGKLLKEQQSALRQIEAVLEDKNYALNQQSELVEMLQEISKIDYDESAYNKTRQELKQFEIFNEKKLRLNEANQQIKGEKEFVTDAIDACEKLENRQKADIETVDSISHEIEGLSELELNVTRAEQDLEKTTTRQKEIMQELYRLKGQLDNLSELEKKLAEKEESKNTLSQKEEIYKNLVQAFGKKGIQGMIIEMAIPEIENEANRILGKMTDNRMALKIEAQKIKKTGGVAETLDINISDEAGTRNYEMYSGGEAFRIDFSIRIALSRLLAKRTGAPLPTLIIDEGFGTQDNVGLEKVKEAISSIQDDFEMILVITHIEELKNAFNTRVEVIKTAEGSMVEVI